MRYDSWTTLSCSAFLSQPESTKARTYFHHYAAFFSACFGEIEKTIFSPNSTSGSCFALSHNRRIDSSKNVDAGDVWQPENTFWTKVSIKLYRKPSDWWSVDMTELFNKYLTINAVDGVFLSLSFLLYSLFQINIETLRRRQRHSFGGWISFKQPFLTTQIIPSENGTEGKNESKYLRKRNINEEILLKKSIHLIFFHYIMELFTKLDVFSLHNDARSFSLLM